MAEFDDLKREKRGNVRDPVRRSARIVITQQELNGLTRDVSSGGAFMFTGDDLIAHLVIGDDENPDKQRVRIVRLETLPGGGVGVAVEFVSD